jgi:cyclopropane-fatty-acyl-phospholipid synthase
VPSSLGGLLTRILGDDLPIRFRFYDGSEVGAPDAPATVVITSPDALSRMLYAPGELGVARAFIAGDLIVEGDFLAALRLRERMPVPRFDAATRIAMARLLGRAALHRVAPPPEEVKLRGRFHSSARDKEAVSHHYDVSNDFYELLLGETMMYSCALWSDPDADLDRAQTAKIELVCRKLDLQPGMRLLDAGCGWGTLAIHAARHYGVSVTAITLSEEQAAYARKRVAEAGLDHQIDLRVQDYRTIQDGAFDVVAAVGLLEHVGSDLPNYPATMFRLLRPGGRFFHHAISRPPFRKKRFPKPTFINSYVFPDADLHEIGHIVSAFQEAGFEVRHVETLRDHYVHTLGCWIDRLEDHWGEAVALIGVGNARVWKLYMTAAILGFEENRLQIHHVLSVKPDSGRSGMSLVPGDWSRPAGRSGV